jgi:hypothetical protein
MTEAERQSSRGLYGEDCEQSRGDGAAGLRQENSGVQWKCRANNSKVLNAEYRQRTSLGHTVLTMDRNSRAERYS